MSINIRKIKLYLKAIGLSALAIVGMPFAAIIPAVMVIISLLPNSQLEIPMGFKERASGVICGLAGVGYCALAYARILEMTSDAWHDAWHEDEYNKSINITE